MGAFNNALNRFTFDDISNSNLASEGRGSKQICRSTRLSIVSSKHNSMPQ